MISLIGGSRGGRATRVGMRPVDGGLWVHLGFFDRLTQLAACVLLPKVEAVNFCLSFPPIGPNSAQTARGRPVGDAAGCGAFVRIWRASLQFFKNPATDFLPR